MESHLKLKSQAPARAFIRPWYTLSASGTILIIGVPFSNRFFLLSLFIYFPPSLLLLLLLLLRASCFSRRLSPLFLIPFATLFPPLASAVSRFLRSPCTTTRRLMNLHESDLSGVRPARNSVGWIFLAIGSSFIDHQPPSVYLATEPRSTESISVPEVYQFVQRESFERAVHIVKSCRYFCSLFDFRCLARVRYGKRRGSVCAWNNDVTSDSGDI